MPTLRLTVPKNDLNEDQKSRFIERLTDTVSTFYVEEKDEDLEDFVNVQIIETAEDGYAVGGDVIG